MPTSDSSWCWHVLSFLIHVVIFLVLGMMNDFFQCVLDILDVMLGDCILFQSYI